MIMSEAPRIYFSSPTLLIKEDFDLTLMSKYDAFYRRIVEFVLEYLEGTQESNLLAVIVDDTDAEFSMHLPPAGFVKSLGKANEYFLKIEEYETCSLIKEMIKKHEA